MHPSNIVEVHDKYTVKPVGSCIYCGSPKDLTDEHVVPFALGGNLVLPSSSCSSCNKITGQFEQAVLRGFMGDARAAGKFPTRRPKERRRSLPIRIERNGQFRDVDLPSEDSPGFMHLPKFTRAGYLVGELCATGTRLAGIETLYFGKPPDRVMQSLKTRRMQSTANLDVTAFARMLAKIGYSAAVAVCGPFPRAEVPVLPLILGRADDAADWVGSVDQDELPDMNGKQFKLTVVSYFRTIGPSVEVVLVTLVRLFASSGATSYEVIVRRHRSPE